MKTTLLRPPRGLSLLVAITALAFFSALPGSSPPAAGSTAPAPAGMEDSTKGGGGPEMIAAREWLLLGPLSFPLPAFNQERETKLEAKDLLEYEHITKKDLRPVSGAKINLIGGGESAWSKVSADTGGVRISSDQGTPWIAYLSGYIEVPRWMKVDFEARSTLPFELTIDGVSVLKRTEAAEYDEGDPVKGETELAQGKHLMMVKAAFVPEDGDEAEEAGEPGSGDSEWRFGLRTAGAEAFEAEPSLSTDPSRPMNIGDVVDAPTIGRVEVSPDGSLYAVWISERIPPEGKSRDRVEVRRVRHGDIVWTFEDLEGARGWSWAPEGNRISYVTTEKDKGTLRVVNLDTGEIETVLEDIEHLGAYRWSPDGTYIAYFIDQEYDPKEEKVKRLLGAYDRRDYERNKSFLHLSSVPGGISRELTTGEHTTYIYDIHPDGKSMLINRYYEDLAARPYAVTEISILKVEDNSIEEVLTGPWIRDAMWSPDGDEILILAGPSTFGSIGANVPEGVVPNEYDTQAYIYDPRTKDVQAITVDFAPAIVSAFWPEPGDYIYFVVEETEYRKLYKYNVRRESFTKIDLPCDVIHSADVAREKAIAMCTGSSADEPTRLYAVDLARGRARIELDPAADRFKYVEIGKIEDWDFTAANGKEIVGRVHYPPEFDPGKEYPCIVYYYGGTSPVIRSFGGRYPKNLWAAMGYVVYVLQPSGATGFGQEFSAAHVNDWGETTSEEIIEGVKKFLDAHPFVDPERVGCIGASYGGFMTQYLLTKTDMFAAAVSHAGISAITSYWGEGYWGYLYSAAATANSFPWNRPDIYVGHSPIYSADKIVTPLLLLHGSSDTNVPPGESEQMYTALKLLGREVEYIRILGENHWILDYEKRIIWSDAILSWFDKWLKDEPEWWDEMYPPLDEGEEQEAGGAPEGRSGGTESLKAGVEEAGEGAPEVEALKMHRPMKMSTRVVQMDEYGTVLFGEVTRQDIAKDLPDWSAEYFDYKPDPGLMAELAKQLRDVEIKAVIGTWCPDCRREIPRLWRILEEVGYPVARMKLFAVASSRFTAEMGVPPEILEWSDAVKKQYDVEAVATIIFTRDGEELGRIVESPKISLEEDMARITSD